MVKEQKIKAVNEIADVLIDNKGKMLIEVAIAIYNAGYRKQKEGEWITSDIPQEKYVCSVCGGACWYYDYQGDVAKSRYCPNCGAKMKVGAE